MAARHAHDELPLAGGGHIASSRSTSFNYYCLEENVTCLQLSVIDLSVDDVTLRCLFTLVANSKAKTSD